MESFFMWTYPKGSLHENPQIQSLRLIQKAKSVNNQSNRMTQKEFHNTTGM